MSIRPDAGTEAVVDAYFDAVARNDLPAIEALVAEDFIQYPPPANSQQDRQAFLEEWRQRIDENPDSALEYERTHRMSETVEAGAREGSWVYEWGTYRRTDGQLTFKLSASFRVHNGRIVEVHGYFDRLDIMTQGGFTLTPPAN